MLGAGCSVVGCLSSSVGLEKFDFYFVSRSQVALKELVITYKLFDRLLTASVKISNLGVFSLKRHILC